MTLNRSIQQWEALLELLKETEEKTDLQLAIEDLITTKNRLMAQSVKSEKRFRNVLRTNEKFIRG